LLLRDYLARVFLLFVAASILLAALTAASYVQERSTGHVSVVLHVFDLQREYVIASWIESLLFVLCSVTFSLLGWSPSSTTIFTAWQRWLYRICALAFFVLAGDEMLMLHERIGEVLQAHAGILAGTGADHTPFSWVLVYLPPAAAVCVALLWTSGRLIARIADAPARTFGLGCLIGAVSMIVVVFATEIAAAALAASGVWLSPLPVFEETAELAALLLFTRAHISVAVAYRL
jgi:hypothetical protein